MELRLNPARGWVELRLSLKNWGRLQDKTVVGHLMLKLEDLFFTCKPNFIRGKYYLFWSYFILLYFILFYYHFILGAPKKASPQILNNKCSSLKVKARKCKKISLVKVIDLRTIHMLRWSNFTKKIFWKVFKH